jgi:lipopolysaccharide/colanic/teichoic acid biosynthesis glycosyltransferase
MLVFGAQVAIIAMTIVFIALAALMLIIQGSSVFFIQKKN